MEYVQECAAMVKHTPGPWKQYRYVCSETGETQFSVQTDRPPALCDDSRSIAVMTGAYLTRPGSRGRDELIAENEANARLIAAAPELLAALVKAVARYEATLATCPHRHETREELIVARAAIAKATAE